ncbi:hypothetical protein IQ07DRAFT_639437 [Pyrenochaeta sp. DS3sAY3a]|nr:hypothetical protein IQ07DRAFT_639437 [Pyrenochaeta sp. DS3sAY3a]
MSIIQPEAGIWYGFCWIIVSIRLISRRLHRGSWKRLQWDDYLILLAMCTVTVVMAVMVKLVKTSSNLIPPEDDVSQYTEDEIRDRIFGSKLVLVVEQMQLLTIWLIKACLLIMYNRMTTILPQHKIVVATAYYVGFTFVIMEILYFAVWCRPFNQYWAVPPNSKQCSAATNHLITNAVFNISSDIIILSIPLPLLFKVRLPKKQKIVLFVIFLIGAFTIVAAALNKYYSFTHPFGTEWTIWYLRESFTAILCANLPLTYPLIQRIFGLRNWSHNTYEAGTSRRAASRPQPSTHRHWTETRDQNVPKAYREGFSRTESQEDINDGVRKQKDDVFEPHFITSAIEMDDTKKSPRSSSLDSPSGWQSVEHNNQQPDPYRVV